ncbi:hypothetical protein [Nonomuraea soli]|uniref:Uncharacterized protein n=1 Tax=Nonomuraea soli TaxID=1032476 RepID=A0A7W0CUH4_9ACTN|nr:hypothetical protein [Nonomuraea soli]MBA2897477.1 hypothetical protein [Nonomuraea soli]
MEPSAAARNNAEWCDLVCRTHGLPGRFGGRAWTNPRRTHVYYPDAVTLSPDATPDDVLAAIDTGAGASVKDSFATLDLGPHGFHVLFEAQWIARPPIPAPAVDGWEVTTDVRAWSTSYPDGLFLPELLEEATLVWRPGTGCGAALNTTGDVVGLSNVFGDPGAAFPGAVAMAAELFPGRPLVGYEAGQELEAAVLAGFQPIGPLRVWLKD